MRQQFPSEDKPKITWKNALLVLFILALVLLVIAAITLPSTIPYLY